MSDNEIYLLIKYIKSVLWRAAKHVGYGLQHCGLVVTCKKSLVSVLLVCEVSHFTHACGSVS